MGWWEALSSCTPTVVIAKLQQEAHAAYTEDSLGTFMDFHDQKGWHFGAPQDAFYIKPLSLRPRVIADLPNIETDKLRRLKNMFKTKEQDKT